nr:hypothetical protein GCM10020093_009180 [Planobispora longispora]
MHIGGGLSRLRTGVRTVHLAEILASTETGGTAAAPGITTAGNSSGPAHTGEKP